MSSVRASEYRWLLPATLTAEPTTDADATGRPRRPRRSGRDWVVDILFFLFAVLFALVAAGDVTQPGSFLAPIKPEQAWLVDLDILLTPVACGALWLRRRRPVGVAVALLPFSVFSMTAGGALLVVLVTVAIHCPFPVAAALTGLHTAAGLVLILLYPDPTLTYVEHALFLLVLNALLMAWGMFVRARRQLVISLRERARRAEAEQRLRTEQARQLERNRIAREMHDVLAHRISLLSLHAGALEFRPDAPPEEIARAAGVIRASAHKALQELRDVIGVLRASDGTADPAADSGAPPERPQPTLDDVPTLVEESRQADMRVDLELHIADPAAVPDGVGRNAYRIVQEGLTNARKHAPGTLVRVLVAGTPGSGLTVEVHNPQPVGSALLPVIPGTGTGIVGLLERTSLAGGRLEHGRTADGGFRLRAWLPWQA